MPLDGALGFQFFDQFGLKFGVGFLLVGADEDGGGGESGGDGVLGGGELALGAARSC